MDDPVFSKVINDKKYDVYFDDFFICDWDFESEQEKKEYFEKHNRGELAFYYVTTSELCPCCTQWMEKDSLGGIDARDYEEALEVFLENFYEPRKFYIKD